MPNILIVDDEKRILDILQEYFLKEGFNCFLAEDGIDALAIIKSNLIDVVILDVMMPEIDGFSLCSLIKNNRDIPIIFLTAKDSEEDELMGYHLGADDYIAKPFSPRVVLAKVKVLLRRQEHMSGKSQKFINVGRLYLYPNEEKVTVDSAVIALTHMEFKLLHFFMQNQNQVFSREQLLNQIWGYDYMGSSRTVDTHIRRLRAKLQTEGKRIVTLIRSGYKFEV